MRVSVAFILHLLGFGILTTTLLAGYILDRKFRSETDTALKLHTATISRIIGLLSPFAVLLLLVTGIANIHNRFFGTTIAWHSEGWLVAKIMLYAVMAFNGLLFGPALTRNRLKIVKTQAEQSPPPDADILIRSYNKQLSLFYLVQTFVFLLIIYLSVFGIGKHPGAF